MFVVFSSGFFKVERQTPNAKRQTFIK